MDITSKINKYIESYKSNVTCDITIEEILQIRDECAKEYYNTGGKLISDGTYDELTRIIRSLGITPKVGAVANVAKELTLKQSFDELAGSLEDEVDIDVIFNFFNTHKQTDMMVSNKGDGNSVTLEYNACTGALKQAVTRGKDGVGVDLTSVFSWSVLPDFLKGGLDTDLVAIKYEALLTYENFKKYCTDNSKDLANPRSAISGILGRNDAHLYSKYISLAPIEIRFSNHELDRQAQIINMEKLIKTNPLYVSLSHKVIKVSDFQKHVDTTLANRDKNPYMIDGIVVEIVNEELRHELGWVGGYPKHSKAFKFPYAEYDTEILDIEFDFGKSSGRLTPCVIIKEVKHNGASYNRVSIANYRRFNELKLGKGSKVLFTYNMDCMGYVDRKNDPFNDTITPIPFITNCPHCNSVLKVNDNETFVNCVNYNCDGIRKGAIENFITKMGIKEFKEARIDAMYKEGIISDIPSIFKIDYDKVAKVKGLGSKTAEKLKVELAKKSSVKDYEILGSFPIENLGRGTSLEICKVISLAELLKKDRDSIEKYFINNKVKDVADVMARIIADGIEKYRDNLKELFQLLDIKETKVKRNTATELSICVTGSISYAGARPALKKYIEEELGQKMVGSVSANTDYLICNSVSTSDSYKSAQKHGVKIISETEFFELVAAKKI
jgi:DNA ligase (NAD+)